MREILIAGAGGALTIAIVVVANLIRTGSSLPRRVTRLEEGLVMMIEVNHAQTAGIIASLEAQRDGRCNGNVSGALDGLQEAQRTSTKFLAAHAVGTR